MPARCDWKYELFLFLIILEGWQIKKWFEDGNLIKTELFLLKDIAKINK